MSQNRADTTSEIPLELPQSSMPSPRKDNLLERGLMFLLSFLLVRLIDDKVFREEAMGELRFNFDGFCKVTKVLLRSAGARPETIKIKDSSLTQVTHASEGDKLFKETFASDPKLLCEQSSEWIGFGFLDWLVGDTERITVDITKEPYSLDSNVTWNSGTKLIECRFLHESGCKSTCLHLCKMPTQALFNEELGLPLRMTPDF